MFWDVKGRTCWSNLVVSILLKRKQQPNQPKTKQTKTHTKQNQQKTTHNKQTNKKYKKPTDPARDRKLQQNSIKVKAEV